MKKTAPSADKKTTVFDTRYNDLIRLPTDDGARENIRDIVAHSKALRLSLKWYGTKGFQVNKFTVNKGGKVIIGFSLTATPTVSVFVAPPPELVHTLDGLSEDFRTMFLGNMKKCSHCNPKHGDGARVTLYGREYSGLCNVGMMVVANPDRNQTSAIKDYISRTNDNLAIDYPNR
ncbi:MAG: hypothetical protein FWG05_01390 [Kiritimatiellaeota bacterium]|nr:hypothetical protein [Kiritimatiellota bacterium]